MQAKLTEHTFIFTALPYKQFNSQNQITNNKQVQVQWKEP